MAKEDGKMIALNILLAVVLTVAAAAVLAVVALGLICLFSPSFDEFGFINECIGCPHAGDYCRGCRCNPEYWDRTTYTGPSRRELREIRKGARE